MPLNLSANLIIRNTDSANSIHITEINYYNSEGELIKSYLNSPKELKPMASTYFLIQTSDTSVGTHSYSFASRGKAIKGVYASGIGPR